MENCDTECMYEKIRNEIIQTIPQGSDSIYLNTSNNYTLQITSVSNELEFLFGNKTSNLSVIDFQKCADLLKEENGLEPDIDLILLKYENNTKNASEKSVIKTINFTLIFALHINQKMIPMFY